MITFESLAGSEWPFFRPRRVRNCSVSLVIFDKKSLTQPMRILGSSLPMEQSLSLCIEIVCPTVNDGFTLMGQFKFTAQ
jgi:hypothetical protein